VVDREIATYRALPVLKRIIRQEEDDPDTGLPHFIVNDPLQWWMMKAESLPILSRLARETLCVPATSAPSERLFSAAGLTIANDRSGLTPDNAADVVFLKTSWDIVNEQVASRRRKRDD
jgi:hypothetical protein